MADTRDPPVPDAEGNVHVECLLGPYRGQILKMSEAQANQAISDKWARFIKYPPIDADEAPPDSYTTEELETAVAAANAAAPILRGEPEPKAKSATVTRDMQAERPSEYTTKAGTAPRAPRR